MMDDLKEMFNSIDVSLKLREGAMPDDAAALTILFEAYQRLKSLGWREAIYCPKDGTPFQAIEAGSTGIHTCHYDGDWPTGHWWISNAGDLWPSHPILFRPFPEGETP
jgi:hypothetical protein